MLKMCSNCNKNPAVVYFSSGSEKKHLCIPCAKAAGIPLPEGLPQSDEDLRKMSSDINSALSELLSNADPDILAQLENTEQDGAPSIDFSKIMGFMQNKKNDQPNGENNAEGNENGKNEQANPFGIKKKNPLSQFCINLTDRAKNDKLDRIIGRERELERVIQILSRRQKNNPCLIGEPGVGKTAIAEALAQKIVAGSVPYRLRKKEVYLVDMTALVAGTQFRGQFEARMKDLINEVVNRGNVILVIDEIHTIVGAGDAEGSMNAANILKPALSRGEIQVVGATTLKEYRKYIEKDSALERRFQPVQVDEPTVEDTARILIGIKKYYEAHHGVKVPDSLLFRTASLSERYITDRFLPDKAIDLLDEACAYLSLHSPVVGNVLELTDTLAALEKEFEDLNANIPTADTPPEEQGKFYKHRSDVQIALDKCKKDLEIARAEQEKLTVTEQELAAVLEVWTGIPQSNITEQEFDKLGDLGKSLRSRIIGQDEAIDALSQAIKRSRMGVSTKRKPASFIFAGPTGVGKTELVKQLTERLFDTPDALVRFDMSEFMERHTVSRLIGSPPGYVGYDDAGQLTEKIRRHPYSVVLFDEIEKAHPDVLNLMLQILDDGRVTDAQGRVVDFCNTVVIMTTNAGAGKGNSVIGFNNDSRQTDSENTHRALAQFLRPEFINRVDAVITFRSLDREDFKKIAFIMLSETTDVLTERGYKTTFTEKAVNTVAKNSFSAEYGARNMRRYLQTHLEDKLANLLIEKKGEPLSFITIDALDDESDLTVISD